MNFNIKTGILFCVLSLPLLGKAQQQLTLRNAIDTALRNNFDIQMAKNDLKIASISNSYGMAGGLPYVSANASDNAASSSNSQKYRDGTESSGNYISDNTVNAGVSAGIVLFNGFKITATKEKLNLLESYSDIQLNQQIQNIIADVMITYYDIIRQQFYLKIIQNTLDVSNQKLEIVNVKNNVGMADAVDMLQAQADVNSAEQLLIIQKMVIEQNKSDLLRILTTKNQMQFSIADTILIDQSLQLDSIINYLKRNPEYLSAEQRILIEEQIVKEVSSQRYPSIKLNAGYDFYHSNINKGNLMMNQNYGPSAGINLQIPIFNGTIYKTQTDAARIRVDNSKLEKENLKNTLTTQAIKTYRSYATTLQQIESQRENFIMTQKLVEVTLLKFNLGQATILDVKAAQTSFEVAAYLLVNLLYSAKVAEIELKQLTYSLGN